MMTTTTMNVGKSANGRITVEEHFYTDDHDIEHYCIRVIGLVGGSDVTTNHTVGDTFWEVC